MSLSLIKQNIEKNVIKTTEEFSRDVMLMFVNAIMYNNHEYDVYVMAQEMYDEAMKAIEVRLADRKSVAHFNRYDNVPKTSVFEFMLLPTNLHSLFKLLS